MRRWSMRARKRHPGGMKGFPDAFMQNFWIKEAAGMAAVGHEECKVALFLRM